MKILQVNNVYKRGSTGKIVYDIHNVLQEEGIESVVCYGRGQKEKETNVYKTCSEILAKINALRSRITGLQYNGSWLATNKLLKIIKKEQPDIVHLQCINGYFINIYRLLNYLKNNKIKTVLTLHAEFMYTGSCGHAYDCEKWLTGCGNCPQLWKATKSYRFDRTATAWVKMKSTFEKFDDLIIISVSKWLENRAMKSTILKDHKFEVVGNGIDTCATFYPKDYKYIREKHKLTNEKTLLHVTANFSLREDDIKGGHYIVKLAEKLKNKNIKIIIIGCQDLSMSLPDNIINVGIINNQEELATYYSLSDLTILVSKRETFSMVCAESLSCGTPIIGFKAGGPETISLPEYSSFVDYGDLNALEEKVNEWINLKLNITSNVISNKARQIYSRKRMSLEYIKVYNQLNRS